MIAPPGSGLRNACLICLDPLPALSWRGTVTNRLLCCGKQVCAGCHRDIHVARVNGPVRDLQETVRCPVCTAQVPNDFPASFELLQVQAEVGGQTWAENNLAHRYETGRGVAKDVPAALKYYQRAAA